MIHWIFYIQQNSQCSILNFSIFHKKNFVFMKTSYSLAVNFNHLEKSIKYIELLPMENGLYFINNLGWLMELIIINIIYGLLVKQYALGNFLIDIFQKLL